MLRNYTARYVQIPSGYIGQLIEWPEVITEGKTIEDCHNMLADALKEMVLSYNKVGRDIPSTNSLDKEAKILIQQNLIKCIEMAEQQGFSNLTLEEISSEVNAVRGNANNS
jgi:predicted RNase H-like HicB family nuclease